MADITPPSIPVVATTPVSASQIDVTWTALDETGVVKSEVRRDGALIVTLTTEITFSDTGLLAGHTYSYVVTVYDAAGNHTDSVPVNGMTQWWPEGYDLPAFRVKRQTYGLMNGGDWVRGSSVTTLPHTALRYPSTVPEDFDPSTSQSLLYTRPFDYNTVEILWGWPTIHTDWLEVALVRSTFGVPSTPQDGMTVFRALRSEFVTATGTAPPPIVYDQLLPTGIPPKTSSGGWTPGLVPNGRTFYYTVFFRTNPIDWVFGMSDSCLLPRDFQHRERMWDVIPPYYQWIDDSFRPGNGYLHQFLTVFGFVLDNAREFIEGVGDLHMIDKTPMSLLKGLGANYGLPYESGIGDIRYRGLVANAPNAQHTRGTVVGLRQVIEAVSKYETDITGSQTTMLFPDDSDFYRSTGNWGGPHPDAVAPILALEPSLTTLDWDQIYVAKVNSTPEVGRGVMRVFTTKADETSSLLIAVGNSRLRADGDLVVEPTDDFIPPDTTDYRDARPVDSGIAIEAGFPYGFSVWIQAPEHDFTVQPVILWTGPSGLPQEVLDVSMGPIASTAGTAWKQYTVQGAAPDSTSTTPESRYMVPGIYIFSRTAGTKVNRSAAIDICGAISYHLGDENTPVSVTPADRYLTLGDSTEALGAPTDTFDGYVMGSPDRTTRST